MQSEEYLTPEETAKLLRVTRRTVYNWLKEGKLPALKYGRSWRIHRSELLPKPRKAEAA